MSDLEKLVREWVLAMKEIVDAQHAKAQATREGAPLDKLIACQLAESMSMTRALIAESQIVQIVVQMTEVDQ